MALITEDGTIIAGAESLCSVAAANIYLKARGVTRWDDLETADKEINLRLATDYLRDTYGQRLAGTPAQSGQAQDWPRFGVPSRDGLGYVPSNVVPAEVLGACALLADKAIDGPLAPDIERATVREKLGPLEVEYDQRAPVATQYRAIDAMLRPYLCGSSSGAMMSLVRA
jgi:hypothetical protein